MTRPEARLVKAEALRFSGVRSAGIRAWNEISRKGACDAASA